MVTALVLVAACRPSRTTESAIPIDVSDAAPPLEVRAPGAASDAAAPVASGPRAAGGAPSSLEVLQDGTLVIANETQVATRAPSGAIARHALPRGATPRTSPELAGLVLDDGEGVVELLATPSLVSLYRGKGTAPFGAPSAIVTEDGSALLLQHEGRLLRVVLPKAGANPRVEAVVPVAGGARLNVSITTDAPASATTSDPPVTTGYLFDPSKGTLVGRGVPLAAIPIDGPRGAHTGDLGFVLAGSRVMRIDLRTANVLKQGTVRCAKGEGPYNPTPSPNGALLLVTCGGDAVVLDGATLVERRRIKDVMPGCDNGNILGGEVLADGHTLRLEGCGGEARIDLDKGRYTCGDGAGIVGAPYSMGLGGPGAVPQAPAGRASLPPCTKDLSRSTSAFGTSGRYRLVHGEQLTIEHAGGVITLEDDSAAVPVIARDEASFAYLRGEKVVVRTLPAGKVLLELSPFAP